MTALLLWSVADLPDFGHYLGTYGKVLNSVAVGERHTTNVVAAVVFDYRGVDTMGEEFILFASVMGVALLLRNPHRERRQVPVRIQSDAVRLAGIGFAAGLLVLGLYVVAHGYLTPGGGFQGGVVLASAFVLVYLAGDYHAYRSLSPTPAIDVVGATGAGGYTVVILSVGYVTRGPAPIFADGPKGTRAVDPVVQALTLTDVVVSVTVAALLLALAIQAQRHADTTDPDELAEMHG